MRLYLARKTTGGKLTVWIYCRSAFSGSISFSSRNTAAPLRSQVCLGHWRSVAFTTTKTFLLWYRHEVTVEHSRYASVKIAFMTVEYLSGLLSVCTLFSMFSWGWHCHVTLFLFLQTRGGFSVVFLAVKLDQGCYTKLWVKIITGNMLSTCRDCFFKTLVIVSYS